MFPLYTENPRLRAPLVTIALLLIIGAVWIFLQTGGLSPYALAASVCNWGLVPGELTQQATVGTAVPLGPGLACIVDREPINVLTPLTSMFLHGGWGHVLGNSLFLWVFGGSIEDSMGRPRYLAFYLICGLAAAAAQIFVNPGSPVPMVGASGAISGVMGAFLVLYPRVRVYLLVFLFFFIDLIAVPAWLVLLYWFGMQVLTGLPELLAVRPDVSEGVAVWAHVGGFAAGALLIRLFANPELVRQRRSRRIERRGRPLWRAR
ncbi:MAG TPA: rhomboid family intramembrane serine protease [Polyangiaceae bacterium]|jgi:membrane associated rhomboid family serine protease|nr:rhomboid family intramembrane serine protease [Polyangiaceae bacterium]